MSNSGLPEDLLLDILAKLPVESLLRFRCVSKSWNALIDSQEFIKLHLNRSIANPRAQKVLVKAPIFDLEHPGAQSYNFYAAEFDSIADNLTANWKEIVDPSFKPDMKVTTLVGSCNGLLCMEIMDNLFLYNPWTKKNWKVPIEAIGSTVPCEVSYGFGHDDVNDDYKIIRISNCGYCCREAKVYSLSSNLCRRIQGLPFNTSYSSKSGVLANCSLHWLPYRQDKSDPNHSIVAIDLRTEQHHLVPLPEIKEGLERVSLQVLNGYLSVVIVSSSDAVTWMMKDYGIKDSWTKLLVVQSSDLIYHLLEPIAYSETRKQLIFHYSMGFVCYDIEGKLSERIYIDTSPVRTRACCCVESLVQPYAGGSKGTFRRAKRRRRM